MDLRGKSITPEDLEQLYQFVAEGKLAYQPFIFTDTLEVGEGLKFIEGETAEGTGNIYWAEANQNRAWEKADAVVKSSRVAGLEHFRAANQQLRIIYEHFLDSLVEQLGGDISDLTFAEIGCNTGYFLHGLALRGAKRCIGYDFTDNSKVFQWFNKVLNINNEFYFAEWDSLTHSLRYADLPDVDVILSVAVTCHLADPVQHLAYLCDHATKAIFVWSPIAYWLNEDQLVIAFGDPGKYPNALDWPLSFDNDVRLSIPLLRQCLEQGSFAKIFELEFPENKAPENWKGWYASQQGYIAFRTSDKKTALHGGRKSRPLPVELVQEGYKGFNIVTRGDKYYALSLTLGHVDLNLFDEMMWKRYQNSNQLIAGDSLDKTRQLIDQVVDSPSLQTDETGFLRKMKNLIRPFVN